MTEEILSTAIKLSTDIGTYSDIIQQLDKLMNKHIEGRVLIGVGSGWGTQSILVPPEAVKDALPIIRESLVRCVEKYKEEFSKL